MGTKNLCKSVISDLEAAFVCRGLWKVYVEHWMWNIRIWCADNRGIQTSDQNRIVLSDILSRS